MRRGIHLFENFPVAVNDTLGGINFMAKSTKKTTHPPAKAPQKKPGASAAKRPAPKKEQPTPAKATQRSAFISILPYMLVVFALILAVCFFTVQILDMDDGAGVIGYGIQWFFCGLLGPAAFLLPLALGFIGVIFVRLHIRFKPADSAPGSSRYNDYCCAKRRVTAQTVLASLTVFLISIMIAVIADEGYDVLELGGMWTDGAEDLLGGGMLGSFFGTLMLIGFKPVISMIILVTALAVVVLFLIGITPDYIITKIQESREARREANALLAAEMAEEEEAISKEEKKHAARMLLFLHYFLHLPER